MSADVFYLLILLTVLVIRAGVYFIPNRDFILFGKVIHHMWVGVALFVLSLFVPISIPFLKLLLTAIGLGLFADHFIYMILGAGDDDAYWAQRSLLGAIFMLALLYLMRNSIYLLLF